MAPRSSHNVGRLEAVRVTYLNLLLFTIVFGREVHHLLDFITRPVRVFPKDDALSLSGGGQSHEGVTGGRAHFQSHTC